MKLPKTFECMGSTIKVEQGYLEKGKNGYYEHEKQLISISTESSREIREQTFWHEVVHCILMHLMYTELNDKEQFVEQMGQCLHQLHKTME